MSTSRPMYINNDLRFLYWNACTFSHSKWNQLQIYLTKEYDDNNTHNNIIHIICISEAKLTSSSLISTESLRGKFGSYIRYYYPCELDPNDISSNGGGLLFYIHSTIHIEECNRLSLAMTSPDLMANDKYSTDIRWIQFEYGKNIKFTLGSIYLHPSASHTAVKRCINNIENCIENTNGPILIAGDFNLKHPLWSKHYGTTNILNKSAEYLVEFIDQHNLTLLNIIYAKHEVTLKPFAKLRAESVVDLALTNQPNFINQLNVLTESGLFSDHNPIDIHITNYSDHQKQNHAIHYRKQEKWRSSDLSTEQWKLYETQLSPYLLKWKDKYVQLLDQNSIRELANQHGKDYVQNVIDDATYKLATIIIKSAEHAVGKKAVGKKYKKCFIIYKTKIQNMLDDTHKARDEYYRLKKLFTRNICNDITQLTNAKNNWNDHVKKFNHFIADINRDEWLKKLDSVYNNERLEQKLSWSSYKQTLPSTTQWTSKINNHITNEPPIDADDGNNNLANYYASVCQLDESIQQDRDPHITQTVKDFNTKLNMEWSNMVNIPDTENTPQNGQISLQEVIDFSNKINCNKAYGCDEIDGYMIKHGGRLLHSCIQLLFNSCWCSGVLPVNFTSSNIFPLYKKGDIHQACNYRPISLTSCLMRLFEKILYSRVESQIKLHPSQAGFRKQHSTLDNLYRLLERVYDAMWSSSNSYGVCLPVIFLDLQKAFDKMDTPSALYKLYTTGLKLNSRMLHFFSAFLNNRYMRTVSLQSISEWYETHTGAPQGTVFGPLIFAVYINDLITELEQNTNNIVHSITIGQYTNGCEAPAFADDIVLIPKQTNQPQGGGRGDVEAIGLLQDKLQSLSNALVICGTWARNWCMSFSKDKTNLLIFRKHQNIIYKDQSKSEKIIESLLKSIPLQLIQSNIIDNSMNFNVELVEQYKYMGITLNGNVGKLTESHINNVLIKIRTRCYQVKRILKDSMPIPVALMFIRSMVHSVYSYGLAFIRLNKSDIKKIYSPLRSIWRTILKLPSFTNTVDLMLELNILPLHIQHQQQLISYIYGLNKKSDTHLVKQLFTYNYNLAKHRGALTKTSESHPYHARPIALEYRELLNTWKTQYITHHDPIVWPSNPTSKKEINSVASHAGLVQLSYQRNPNTGLSSIKLLPDEITKINNKSKANSIQQKKEQQRKSIVVNKRSHSLQTKKPILNPSQLSLTNRGEITDSYLLNKTSYLRNEPYMKHDSQIISRMRCQLRMNRAPTYSTINQYCVTEQQRLIIKPYIERCRGCKQLIDETIEHTLLYCPRHLIARDLLKAKLQVGDLSSKTQQSPQFMMLLNDNQHLLKLSLPLILGQTHLLPNKLIKPVLQWTGNFINDVYKNHPLAFISKNYISTLGDSVYKLLRPP
jgi:hypothetical protein